MDSVSQNNKSSRSMKDKLRKIFERSQEQYRHQPLIEKCKALYKEYGEGDNFLEEFKTALRFSLAYPDKQAGDNILTFVSKFVINLYVSESCEDDLNKSDTIHEGCTFPNAILELLFKTHNASLKQVRLRCLQLLNKILSGMPENSTISDSIWAKLKETVLTRIQDKSSSVRVQAVLTARKLQDPKNPNCEIMKAFVFHLNDPCSAVRRTVVSSIAFNKLTIGHVLARTRDVNDNVRRNIYVIFSKVRVLNLSIKYRLTILERGLQDRSVMVRNCVQSLLLVSWLENFNKDVLKFMEALDVVNCPDLVLKIVENIFKVRAMDEIVKELPFNEETRIIPSEALTPEIALLWRAIANHFWTEHNDEELEKVLPNLTVFCDYVRSLYSLDKKKSLNLSREEKWEEIKEKEILRHLLKLFHVFDLADELGRLNMKKLLLDMLVSERIDDDLIECLVELVASATASSEEFLRQMTEIISELREPLIVETAQISMENEIKISDLKVMLNDLREKEYNAASSKNYTMAQEMKAEIEKIEAELKSLSSENPLNQEEREEKNDPETVCRCLTILIHMVKYSKINILTPTLRNIKENFLQQCLKSQDLLTQSLSLQVLGQFCVLDLDLAKENLFRFLFVISKNGEDEINKPVLKSIFDILLSHGIKPFEKLHDFDDDKQGDPSVKDRKPPPLEDDEEDLFICEPEETDMSHSIKFIPLLMELLNCKSNDVLKSIAFEGLCKLLLSGFIYSPKILTKIILNGFSPIIDNDCEDFIRQVFVIFFPAFASKTPRGQEMIEAAFIPTLKALDQASLGTPEADIDARDVASFLIDYTAPDVNKQASMTLHVHNSLALSICHELLKEVDTSSDSEILTLYLKSLLQLKLALDKEHFVGQLKILVNKIKKEVTDRTLLKLVNEFKKRIEDYSRKTLISVDSTLPVDNPVHHVPELKEFVHQVENVMSEQKQTEKTCQNIKKVEEHSSGSDEFLNSPVSTGRKITFVPESPDISE